LKIIDYCCINKCVIREKIRNFAFYYKLRNFVLAE
jgi:hypothetical protein